MLLMFRLAFFERNNSFYSSAQLQADVQSHYTMQFIKQLYVLVLGLDIIGNPFGLVRDLSSGVEDLFYQPFQVRKTICELTWFGHAISVIFWVASCSENVRYDLCEGRNNQHGILMGLQTIANEISGLSDVLNLAYVFQQSIANFQGEISRLSNVLNVRYDF